MWFWLVGCRLSTMIEVPGGAVPGPVRRDEPKWSWPAEVPSLAGCTWTESGLTPGDETVVWTYDREGRLVTRASSRDGVESVSTYFWRESCLTGTSIETTGPEATASGMLATVHQYDCDRHDNKVAWEELVTIPGGELAPVEGQARTFVNTYDALEQLATVETWTTGDPVAPSAVDTFTWNADAQPLVQVREEPLAGAETTWTWWWDHELLLGRDEEGTGADTYTSRRWEDRRLVAEVVTSDGEEATTTTWDYADDDAGFPDAKHVSSGALGVLDRRIEVSCAR